MAFCPNCGNNNYEGATNCTHCGTSLVGGYAPQKKNNTGLIAGIVAAAIAIIAIIVVVSFAGNSPETPIKNYIKSINTGEIKYLKKALPKAMYEEYLDDIDDAEEMLDRIKEEAEDEYGSGKFKYEIIRKTKIDSDELEDTEKFLEAVYERENLKTPKVTAGYEMRVAVTYDGSKDTESDTETLNVYKVDGQWCMFGF